MKACIVAGCPRTRGEAKGMCESHYRRNLKYGDPLGAAPQVSTEERFWLKVEKTETCWNWTAGKADGYGRIRMRGQYSQAHRVSYEMAYGPIEAGLLIDHICHNRACVNPEHLRPVTNKQNAEHRQGPQVNSTTGVLGVVWEERIGKYYAQVVHHGKRHFAGNHPTIEGAEAAAIAKRNELFTCNNIDRVATP